MARKHRTKQQGVAQGAPAEGQGGQRRSPASPPPRPSPHPSPRPSPRQPARLKPPPAHPKALPELDRAEPWDVRQIDLSPVRDELAQVEQPDELHAYYLQLARSQGLVYALAMRWAVDKLYRDHDYLQRYQRKTNKGSYDKLLLRDLKMLAWLMAAVMRYVPDEVKAQKIPPPPVRPDRSLPYTRALEREAQADKRVAPGREALTKAEQVRRARELLQQQLMGNDETKKAITTPEEDV